MTQHRIQPASGKPAVAVAVFAGLALSGLAWFLDPIQWLHGYLVAWLFWVSLAVGSIGLLLLHNLTGGAWGAAIRRGLLAVGSTVPLVAVFALPLGLQLPLIYPWADPSAVAADELLRHKEPYLNVPFFRGRAIGYFIIWTALWLIAAWQWRREGRIRSRTMRRVRTLSGVGLAVHGFSVTFAAIDWGMSLEPHWYSSIYGVLFWIGMGLSALALAILGKVLGRGARAPVDPIVRGQFHDLGKMLHAAVIMWTYMAFMQFLIIYYGNIPEEVHWYVRRIDHGWGIVIAAATICGFVIPFFALLSRDLKQNGIQLATVSAIVLAGYWLNLLWMIGPAFAPTELVTQWSAAATTAAIGGFWLLAAAGSASRLAAVRERHKPATKPHE